MIKSLKGQLILSIIVAIGFVYINFSSIDLTRGTIFFFIMVSSVFNAGLLTENTFKQERRNNSYSINGCFT